MRIGVYDCIYVALAEHEKCELVTADTTLVRVLQPTLWLARVWTGCNATLISDRRGSDRSDG